MCCLGELQHGLTKWVIKMLLWIYGVARRNIFFGEVAFVKHVSKKRYSTFKMRWTPKIGPEVKL